MSHAQELIHKSKSPRRRKYTRYGCMALLVLTVAVVITFWFYRYATYARFTPDEIAMARQLETQIVELPSDWHQPATLPSPEVLEFWDKFLAEMDAIQEKHSLTPEKTSFLETSASLLYRNLSENGQSVPAELRTSYTALIADLLPVIDLTSTSVAMQGYTMEVDMYTSPTVNRFYAIQTFTRLLIIDAREKAKQGEYMKAIELATLPIRLIKRTEQARLIDSIVAVEVTSVSLNAVDTIADLCSNVEVFSQIVPLLKQLRSTAFPGDYNLWKYGDSVGELRYAAAVGYPVDLSPQTIVSYLRQSTSLYHPKYFMWVIDNLPKGDRRVEIAKSILYPPWRQHGLSFFQRVNGRWLSSDDPIIHAIYSKLSGIDPWALHYLELKPSQIRTDNRTQLVIARYDLTQMHFARRIAELKGEPMPAPLDDPFSTGTLQFSAGRNAYYSIGPDKADQRAAVWYDATNGTVSSGDVLVGRER